MNIHFSEQARIRPAAVTYNSKLSLSLLMHQDLRDAASPEAAPTEFP